MSVKMVRTSAFLPLIMPFVPTCPAFIAEQQVRFAAIRLAERSRAWRHLAEVEITSDGICIPMLSGEIGGMGLDYVSGESEFDLIFTVGGGYECGSEGDPMLFPPSPAVIHEIEFAEFNGKRLTPVQFSTMSSVTAGPPEYITQVAPNIVTLLPFSPGALRVSMFLKPAADSEFGSDPLDPMFDRFNVVPDFFQTIHGRVIAAGALAQIFAIEDEPWSNETKARDYQKTFTEGLDSSFRWNMRGQQRAPTRTKYRDF